MRKGWKRVPGLHLLDVEAQHLATRHLARGSRAVLTLCQRLVPNLLELGEVIVDGHLDTLCGLGL
jgi:hypothetical protein